MNNTCHKRWFCFLHKSLSINSNTSLSSLSILIDETIKDYCETNLDDILHLKRTFSLDKSPRKIRHLQSSGYINKKKIFRYKKQTKSCCLTEFCHRTKKNIKEKKELTLTQQIFAPILTLKDLISTSSSSSNDTKPVSLLEEPPITITPQSLLSDPLSSISTPKPLLVHSYSSLSDCRLKSNLNHRQYSLEEQIHSEECRYCSSESALSKKTNPNNNNNQSDQISIHSLNLLHSVEMYLSSNNSLNDQIDLSSIASEQHASITEIKQLSLCEINEIIYAIHSTIDNNNERNQTLDALALSLRQVAEEIPVVLQDEHEMITIANVPEPPPPPPPPGLGQILVRAVMYEIVMRLFSFYLFILMCCARFT